MTPPQTTPTARPQTTATAPRPARPRSWRALVGVTVWGLCLAGALRVYSPAGSYVQEFNSDMAVAVLMSNDQALDLFRAYYYGQDRLGAWPFLAARAVGRAAGFAWTPVGVFSYQTVWLFLSVLPVAGLAARGSRLVVCLAYLCVLCLHTTAGVYVYDISQPYPWQTTPLLGGWWCLRRLIESDAASGPRRAAAYWLGPAFALALLATWTSAASAPLLAFLCLTELARDRIRAPDAGKARRGARAALALLPVVAAACAELLLRSAYHRFALRHFGQEFRTPLGLDWGHLSENLSALAHEFARTRWFPLTLLSVAAGFAVCYLLAGVRRRAAPTSPDAARQPPDAEARFLLDTSILVLGCAGIAALNYLLAAAVVWVRLNGHHGRYLTLSHVFGSFGGLLVLVLALSGLKFFAARRRLLFDSLAAACVALLFLLFPAARASEAYPRLQSVAAALARRAPSGVLLGGYYGTYLFAGLQTADGALIPVPARYQYVRTPWTPRVMRRAPLVVVGHHGYEYFGPPRDPAPWLYQHDTLLRLTQPGWYEEGEYAFSLYANETHKAVAHDPAPPSEQWRLCRAGGAYRLSFAPLVNPTVLLFTRSVAPLPEPQLEVEALSDEGPAGGAKVSVSRHPSLYLLQVQSGATPITGLLIRAQGDSRPAVADEADCDISAVAVLPDGTWEK